MVGSSDNDHLYTAKLDVLPSITAAEAALKYMKDFPNFPNDRCRMRTKDTFPSREVIRVLFVVCKLLRWGGW